MSKILSILIVIILLFSSLGVIVSSENNNNNKYYEKSILISFNEPKIVQKNNFDIIQIEGINTNLNIPGLPFLPCYIENYRFPIGTKIKNIEISCSEKNIYSLENKIIITPQPQTIKDGKILYTNIQDDITNYEKYPLNNYDYNIGVGIENGEHTIFLTLRCFPVQYIPDVNLIFFYKDYEIVVTFDPPKIQISYPDEFDMIIVLTGDPFYGNHFESWPSEKANINLVADFIASLPSE